MYIYVPILENPTFSPTDIAIVITTFGDNPDDLFEEIKCYIRVECKYISISISFNVFNKVEALLETIVIKYDDIIIWVLKVKYTNKRKQIVSVIENIFKS